jgi:hypothetical protein
MRAGWRMAGRGKLVSALIAGYVCFLMHEQNTHPILSHCFAVPCQSARKKAGAGGPSHFFEKQL